MCRFIKTNSARSMAKDKSLCSHVKLQKMSWPTGGTFYKTEKSGWKSTTSKQARMRWMKTATSKRLKSRGWKRWGALLTHIRIRGREGMGIEGSMFRTKTKSTLGKKRSRKDPSFLILRKVEKHQLRKRSRKRWLGAPNCKANKVLSEKLSLWIRISMRKTGRSRRNWKRLKNIY